MSVSCAALPEIALTRWLHELPNYVVLRNEEDLFGNLERGGDIDLLVGDLQLAERMLIRHLGPPVRILRSSYVTGYSYDWGHVDLLPTLEWRGAGYLRAESVLENRQCSPSGRPVPRIAHEAVISWLTTLLFGGVFKERYTGAIQKAVETDGDVFRWTLIDVAGKTIGKRLWQAAVDGRPHISAEWTRALRLSVWSRACFRSPLRTIRRCFAYVIAEVRLRFEPPVPCVAIVDADGSGTSSAVNAIVHRFARCPYGSVKAIRLRPRSTLSRTAIGSRLTLLFVATNWVAAYWTQLVHLRAKGFILTFDGMPSDLIADATCPGNRTRPHERAFSWMLPKADLVFVSSANVPLSVFVDDVQRAVRTWILDRSVSTLNRLKVTASARSSGASRGAPLW
jgi:hypothetical protein